MSPDGAPAEPSRSARVDLHSHTSASFDGVAEPEALVIRAAERGLTHLAITDHETLDGAFRAVAAAPAEIQVLVGCEVNSPEGDLIFVFLERALPRGLSARDAIARGREQGALVGIPHPYDPGRRSLLLDPANEDIVRTVDWVEGWNGRVPNQGANDQAARLAHRMEVPAIGVSDAHTLTEMGTGYTLMTGDPSTRAGLLEALRHPLEINGPTEAIASGRPGWRERLRSGGRRSGSVP